MRLAILYSGGKDSNLALLKAKEKGHEIVCLVCLESENKESYMFHTPSITKVGAQAKALRIPLLEWKTKGEKEKELKDLKGALEKAKKDYGVEGVVSGAVESVYQATRVQKICYELDLWCFNPLWKKDQVEILEELLENKFEVIVVGAFAEPLDKGFLGRKVDNEFIEEMKKLRLKYHINEAGEGGEYETFVLNGLLFKKGLKVKSYEDFGLSNSWRREVEVK